MQKNPTPDPEKEEFQTTLSKISHEIRNPLALVSSELQILASRHPEISSYDGWDDILDNLEYIRELLNQLSSYADAWRLNLVPVNVPHFLSSVVKTFSPTLDYLGITLETDISPALPTLPLDPVKMRQSLLNLLRNAQEALTLPAGKILVQAKASREQVCISISDNGCGMTDEQLKTLFTPFVTYKNGGTGLGLAITRQIIEAHNGSITVESRPGQGTSFRIFLG